MSDRLTYRQAVQRGYGREWGEINALHGDRFFCALLAAMFTLPAVLMWTNLEAGTSPWVYWPIRAALALLALLLWLGSFAAHLELRSLKR